MYFTVAGIVHLANDGIHRKTKGILCYTKCTMKLVQRNFRKKNGFEYAGSHQVRSGEPWLQHILHITISFLLLRGCYKEIYLYHFKTPRSSGNEPSSTFKMIALCKQSLLITRSRIQWMRVYSYMCVYCE